MGQEIYVEPTRHLIFNKHEAYSSRPSLSSAVHRLAGNAWSDLTSYSSGTQNARWIDFDVELVRNNYGSASIFSLPFWPGSSMLQACHREAHRKLIVEARFYDFCPAQLVSGRASPAA
jgi:hypothetical protein